MATKKEKKELRGLNTLLAAPQTAPQAAQLSGYDMQLPPCPRIN